MSMSHPPGLGTVPSISTRMLLFGENELNKKVVGTATPGATDMEDPDCKLLS